jgi:hypothetical protein
MTPVSTTVMPSLRFRRGGSQLPKRNEHPNILTIRLELATGPDTRTLFERVQDEYRYQKSKLGW